MATTKNATYKIYNGTDWDTIYFKTSAGQVGETNGTLNFLRPGTHKVNGKSFWSGSAHQGITLYATDILMQESGATIAARIGSIDEQILTVRDDFETADTGLSNRITALEGVIGGSGGGSLSDIYQTKEDALDQHDDLLDTVNGLLAGYATPANVQTAKDGAIASAKSYTDGAISALVNGAPEALNTLDELAAALKDNANIVTVLEEAIGSKASQGDLNLLSNDYSSFKNTVSNTYEPKFTGASKSRVIVSDTNGKLSESSITTTKLGYLTDVTSNIQAQINGKEPTFTGANKSRVIVSDTNGKLSESSITTTKLGYLTDVTSNIQAQLNGKQAANANIRKIFEGSTTPTGMSTGDIWINY